MRGVVEHETTTGGSIAFIVQLARTTVARAEFVLQVGAMTRCLLKKIAIPTLRAEKGILIGIPSDTADLRMDGRGDDLHKRCGSSHGYSISKRHKNRSIWLHSSQHYRPFQTNTAGHGTVTKPT